MDTLWGRKKSDPLAVYEGLRTQAMATSATVVGADPSKDDVFGVLMDMGRDTYNATILSLIDGTTSLYTSAGGGVIGGGGHERPAAASLELVRTAEHDRELFSADWNDGLLEDGLIRFIVVTPSGTLAAVAAYGVLVSGKDPLSAVFSAANNVITELRMVSGG